MPDIFDEITIEEGAKTDIFDTLVPETKDVGEIRAYKPSLGGNIRNALVGGAFGNLFLRNQPNPEDEKRRALLASTLNTATLGVPQAIAQYGLGGNLAPVKAPTQEMLGGLVGMATPMGVAGGVSNLVKGAGLGAKVARGAISGGVFGAALPGKVEERTSKGAWGVGIGGALSFVSSIAPKLINLGGRKTAQAIAEKADKGIDKLSQSLSDKYDDVLGKMKGSYKPQSIIDDIQQTIDEFPEGANVGKLKSIIKRLETSPDVSANELFNIKKEIGKTIPRSVWNGVSDADAMTNAREQLYWKLTEKLEGLGGEEFKGLTAEYKNFKQAERLARKMFYKQGVASNAPMGGTYDVPTQKAVGGLNSQLPGEEQFAQDFEAWRRGQGVKKWGSRIGGGALAYEVLRRTFNQR